MEDAESETPRRVIVDTDTAGDDTQAILLAALSDRIDLEAVTVVCGNVPFEYEVENAKYTLELAGVADRVPVHEGAREPLLKEFDHATDVHGEGGLGGDLFPDTGLPTADDHAVEAILERARAAPGDVSLLCIGPLTNVAMALHREPDLGELLDRVWVMGGNVNCRGNVTPAAEYNFWVDPDAAKVVLERLQVTLVDWGLSLRESLFCPSFFEWAGDLDTELSDYFLTVTEQVRATMEERTGTAGATQPDSLTTAVAAYPGIVDAADTYHVDVDEREGLTRGYTAVDETGVTGNPARTRVIESVDADRFEAIFRSMLADRDPTP